MWGRARRREERTSIGRERESEPKKEPFAEQVSHEEKKFGVGDFGKNRADELAATGSLAPNGREAEASGSLPDQAASYAAQGLAILPLEPGGKEPLSRFAPHGVYSTTAPEKIRAWWTQCPGGEHRGCHQAQAAQWLVSGHRRCRSAPRWGYHTRRARSPPWPIAHHDRSADGRRASPLVHR